MAVNAPDRSLLNTDSGDEPFSWCGPSVLRVI